MENPERFIEIKWVNMFKMYPLWNYQHKSPWTCACCQQNNHPSTIKIIKIINSFQLYLFFLPLNGSLTRSFLGVKQKRQKSHPSNWGCNPVNLQGCRNYWSHPLTLIFLESIQDELPFFWMDMILSEIYPPRMVHCFWVCACFHASWALGQGIFVGAIYLMG